MNRFHYHRRARASVLSLLFLLFVYTVPTSAGGKVGIYGLYMAPYGIHASDFSRPGWGAGLHVVVPVPQLWNILAGVGGFEFVNLLSQTTEFRDSQTGLRVEQQTNQDYVRFYVGAQIGAHGPGFIRPHAGLNLALVYYGISTDVVVPDDANRERDIRQNLRSTGHTIFGFDLSMGLDLNIENSVAVDGGVRYVKSFSLPQQLGDGAVTVYPQYFQIYLGVGLTFDFIASRKKE